MRANEFITELFDRPLRYSIDSYGDGHFTVGEIDYDVAFTEFDKDHVEIIFVAGQETEDGRETTTAMTGTGGEFAVFSTVAKIILNKFSTYRPENFKFSANKGESSRVKLYIRLAKILAQKLNYTLNIKYTRHEVIFDFYRNDK